MVGRARDSKRETFWREVIASHAASGQSVRAFCQTRRVADYNFYAWRRELSKRDGGSARSGFVPVRVVAEVMIEVVLISGVIVRVPGTTDPATVARWVAALGAASC